MRGDFSDGVQNRVIETIHPCIDACLHPYSFEPSM
jgi:hypothetical protein